MNYFNTKLTKIDNDSSWRISSEQFIYSTTPLASATNNLMRITMEDNMNKDLMADLALKELLVRLMQTQANKLIENDYKKKKKYQQISFLLLIILK